MNNENDGHVLRVTIDADEAVVPNAKPVQQAAPEKVIFSKKQQQKVDELIRVAQSRAARGLRAELAAVTEELEAVQHSLVLSRRTLMRQTLGESLKSERGVR